MIGNLKLIGVFLAILALGFGLHKLSLWTVNIKHERALTAQAEALNTRCEAEKKTTREVSRDYQTKISSLNSQLSRLKRVRPNCIMPAPGPPAGRNGPSSAGEFSGSNGISTDWLFDYAGSAEETRLKLLSCQDFITRTTKGN